MEPVFTLTAFTPAEAASITGVSTTLQRDWRRHRYLPASEGHARFDAFDIARMLTMKALADRGIGPKQSCEIADLCAAGIVQHALGVVDAWEGDHGRALEDLPGIEDIPDEAAELAEYVMRIASSNPNENDKLKIVQPEPIRRWRLKSNYLINRLWRSLQTDIFEERVPRAFGNCFIWWADGDHTFSPSLEHALKHMSLSDEATRGSIVVLLFEALADLLIERSGRALCHVEFDESTE